MVDFPKSRHCSMIYGVHHQDMGRFTMVKAVKPSQISRFEVVLCSRVQRFGKVGYEYTAGCLRRIVTIWNLSNCC